MKRKPCGHRVQIFKAVLTISIVGFTIAIASNTLHTTPYYVTLAQESAANQQTKLSPKHYDHVNYIRTVSN